MLAAMFATRHPEAVERLLLLSPGPLARKYWASRTERTNEAIGAEGVARIAALAREIGSTPDDPVAALCKERIELIFRAYLNDVSALQRMRVGYCDGAAAAIRHETTAGDYLYPSLGDYDLTPDLAKLTQPALVVEGADTKVPLEATKAWAAALPNGRLLLIPRASHIVWVEGDIARTMALLNQFLGDSWPADSEVVRR
jgi:pimeloyl-ACP methyl ester carboxylesterase